MSFVKTASVYGIADFVIKIVYFFTFPIFANIFSLEDYGILSLVLTGTAICGVIANMGIETALQRFYFELPEGDQQKKLVSTGLIVLICSAVLSVGLMLIALYFYQSRFPSSIGIPISMIVLGLSASLPLQLIEYCQSVLRLQFLPWRFVAVALSQNLLALSLSLLFAYYFSWGLEGYFLGVIIGICAVLPLPLWFVWDKITFSFDFSVAKKMIKFGYPLVILNIGYWIFGGLDRWLLAALSTIAEVGLYSIAFKFTTILQFMVIAFGAAFVPYAMKLYNTEKNYRDSYVKILTQWLFFLVIVYFCVGAFSQEALLFLTREEYWAASQIVPILSLGMVFYGVSRLLVIGFFIEKKTHHLSIAYWLGAVVNVVLGFLLVPSLGAKGAAIATSFAYLFIVLYQLFFSQKLHPLPLEKYKLSCCIGLLGVSYVFLEFITQIPWGWHITFLKLSALTGLIAIGFLLKLFHWSDVVQLAYKGLSRIRRVIGLENKTA